MIRTCSYYVDYRGKEIISGMVNFLDPKANPEIIDLACYPIPEFDKNDIVLIYGKRAARELEGVKIEKRLIFDELSALDGTFGQETSRQEAFEQLQKFKEAITEGQSNGAVAPISITENLLPSLTSNEILKKSLSGQDWIGTTRSGQLVRLSLEKKEKGKEDISLTFTELFAMKTAMETLGIRELEIVACQKDSRK
jgi:hypothetical protein